MTHGKESAMKKHRNRLAAALLALLLLVLPGQGAFAATLQELQQEQARLEQEKEENDAKLDELKADQSKQQEYKNTLDAQVQNLQNPMNYFS